jgi:hypothetical protein
MFLTYSTRSKLKILKISINKLLKLFIDVENNATNSTSNIDPKQNGGNYKFKTFDL